MLAYPKSTAHYKAVLWVKTHFSLHSPGADAPHCLEAVCPSASAGGSGRLGSTAVPAVLLACNPPHPSPCSGGCLLKGTAIAVHVLHSLVRLIVWAELMNYTSKRGLKTLFFAQELMFCGICSMNQDKSLTLNFQFFLKNRHNDSLVNVCH